MGNSSADGTAQIKGAILSRERMAWWNRLLPLDFINLAGACRGGIAALAADEIVKALP